MAVEIAMQGDILCITLTGTLHETDLHEIGSSVAAIENSLSIAPPRLADLSGLQKVSVGYAEMSILAEQRRNSALANSIRTALLVKTPVQMGMARMFQTLNDHPRITLEIFEDRERALSWLDSR